MVSVEFPYQLASAPNEREMLPTHPERAIPVSRSRHRTGKELLSLVDGRGPERWKTWRRLRSTVIARVMHVRVVENAIANWVWTTMKEARSLAQKIEPKRTMSVIEVCMSRGCFFIYSTDVAISQLTAKGRSRLLHRFEWLRLLLSTDSGGIPPSTSIFHFDSKWSWWASCTLPAHLNSNPFL